MILNCLKRLKNAIRDDSFIVANRGSISSGGVFDSIAFENAVWRVVLEADSPFVVQVGAHFGNASHDMKAQLKKTSASALLVEPQPEAFLKLTRNYSDCPAVTLANVAVSDVSTTRPMYRIAENANQYHRTGGRFATSIASFNPEHPWQYFRRNATSAGLSADRNAVIESVTVDCLTFSELASRHRIERIDVLAVDTEGFDFEILKMAFEAGFRPTLVKYEHKHLADRQEMRGAWKFMIDRGYRVVVVRATGDTVGLKTKDW